MSGNIPNELTVYLRPHEAVQPYVIIECAKWMVRTSKSLCVRDALNLLQYWDEKSPEQFKYMISEYHRYNDYHPEDVTNFRKNMNVAYSVPGPYGDESHMHYNIQNLDKYI